MFLFSKFNLFGILYIIVLLLYLFLGGFLSVRAQNKPILLALNKTEGSLAFIDPNDMKLLGKVPTGDNPHEVVASSDGKIAFVANYGAQTPGNSLSVIDIETRKELRRVDLLPLMRPHGLVELGGKLYFTSETNRLIARYDPVVNKVDWIMGTGQNATHMIVAAPDQKRFYTTNIASDTITAFNFQNVPPAASSITNIMVGKQPEAIDLSPDGNEVWVGLNAEGAVDIVDTKVNKFKEKVNIGGRPYRIKFTPDGKQVLFTMPNSNELLIYDAATRKELKRIKLEGTPLGVVTSKDGKIAFLSVVQPDCILKIDLEKGEIIGKAETGQGPDGVALSGM